MRREILYLTDIVEAADHIANFITGVNFQQFQESELIRSAVAQKLAIIGEAAGRAPEELRTRNPQVPCSRIIAFRNVIIHGYFGIDWVEVWRSAKDRCPKLREEVKKILAAEYSQSEGG